MNLLFFEDAMTVRFYPNALTRPLDDMRLGVLTIGEKWLHETGAARHSRLLRPWLGGVFEAPMPDPERHWVWILSRSVPLAGIGTELNGLRMGEGLTVDGVPIAVAMDGDDTLRYFKQQAAFADQFWSAFEVKHSPADPLRYRHVETNFQGIAFRETTRARVLDHAWDFSHHNAAEIGRDIPRLRAVETLDRWTERPFFATHPERVFVGKGVKIGIGAMLDASAGPIWLGDHAEIMSGAMLKGPVAICDHALVRMGAKIYEGTTAGPWCKLGGEVQAAVFQAYSNKAHDGYIGNSLIGEWVNIGADTNNSNLKNNYTSVKVYDWESGDLLDSGLQFCGLFLADHCKTAINSMLNSGTVCGISSSVLTNNFPPKYIPSFGWVTDTSIDVFELDKALSTARTMMARRGLGLSPAYERMMRYLFSVRDGRTG